jgi:hypothetical protein
MPDFNPDDFMSQTVDQPLDIERTMVPEGEYKARIDDFTSDAFETFKFEYKRGPNAGQEGQMHKFNCPLVIDDAALQAKMQMDKIRVYHTCTLDFDDQGQLMFGPNRNIDLGKLRNAVGQNNPGPWSIGMLRGAGPFMVKVQHRRGKRKDGTDFTIAEPIRFAPIR